MTKSNELNVPPRPIVHLGNDPAAHPVANLSEVVRPSGRRMMSSPPRCRATGRATNSAASLVG
jgi:hypothetical protein